MGLKVCKNANSPYLHTFLYEIRLDSEIHISISYTHILYNIVPTRTYALILKVYSFDLARRISNDKCAIVYFYLAKSWRTNLKLYSFFMQIAVAQLFPLYKFDRCVICTNETIFRGDTIQNNFACRCTWAFD